MSIHIHGQKREELSVNLKPHCQKKKIPKIHTHTHREEK